MLSAEVEEHLEEGVVNENCDSLRGFRKSLLCSRPLMNTVTLAIN